jgi:hypothetical protein
VLLAGALVTGLLVPTITRRWQDRQKELEIKTELVSDLSEAITQIVMAVQFVHIWTSIGRVQPGTAAADKVQEEFDQAYRTWETRSAVLATKLEAYFAGTNIPAEWTRYSDLVTRFYALEGLGDRREAAMDALRKDLTAALGSDQRIEEGWVGLREGLLRKRDDIIRRVLSSRIVIFQPRLFAR